MAIEEKPYARTHTYKSVEGRPIEVFSFGEGKRTILLMAGVHGDEKNGVEMVRSILKKLENRFQVAGCKFQVAGCSVSQPETLNLKPETALRERIVVMPLCNPDGYEANTRRNARGIDINRNFPTKDFGSGEEKPGGTEPASEPETRAILEVVERFEPYLIITLHEALACVNCNGDLAVPVAERMSEICGLEMKGDIGYPCPGSMGTYYGWERSLPVITLELPSDGVDLSPVEQAVIEALGMQMGNG